MSAHARHHAHHEVFVAWYEREEDVLAAVSAAREAGLTIHDVYTPYAVHGMDAAMGLRPSRLPWVCLGAGLFGGGFAWAVQYWASVVSWPINVGGKPFHSLPAFVPVAFELTVLCAALATVFALLVREGLLPGAHPRTLARVTDDRFALALDTTGVKFDAEQARKVLERFHAVEIAREELDR